MGSKGLNDEERVAMQQEADKHGPFLWLPIKVRYLTCLQLLQAGLFGRDLGQHAMWPHSEPARCL